MHRREGEGRLGGDGRRRPEDPPDAARATAPSLPLASPLAVRADAQRPALTPRAGLEPERLMVAGESCGRGGDLRLAARGAEDTPGASVGEGRGGREGARTAPMAGAIPRRRGDGDAPRWDVVLPPPTKAPGVRCCRACPPPTVLLRPVLASRAPPTCGTSAELPSVRLSPLPGGRATKDAVLGPGEGDRQEKVSRISPRSRSSSM